VAQTESPAIIVETIVINAPATAVFAALTEPEELAAWWGHDDTYRTTAMERDLRVGGAWKTSGRSRDGKPFTVFGTYRIVDVPKLLEFTWQHDFHDGADSEIETVVRYELEEHDGVTQLRLTHSGFASIGDRDDHANGWKTVLNWLKNHVERR
jgi:uncharacterized protein YndB with AHSA1/START domain